MSQSVSSTRASKAPLTNVGGKSEVIKTRTGYSFRKAVGHIPEVVRALKAAGHDYAPIVDRASTFGEEYGRGPGAGVFMRELSVLPFRHNGH
jgi:hypothetical protein